MSCTVKLLICYHKKDVLLKDDILTPIHVGRVLARKRMGEDSPQFKWLAENMIGDDTGENISKKNLSYNELTAVYWAWKNYDKLGNPDYIGLMHYRRHFIFRESPDVVEEVRGIDGNYFNRINYSPETMAHLFDDCDFVAHIGHVDEVYKHYKENHHIEDLDLAISILKEKYPEYVSTADAYLKMSYVNLCNMFIMPRDMFFEYCEWLFDILEEFEKQVDLSEKRLFISERLTGIFIEHKKRKGLKQKALSATFVQSDMHIPVVMPFCSDIFRTAVTMASIIKNAEPLTHADFYILHNGEIRGDEFDEFIARYKGNTVTYVNVKERLAECGVDFDKFIFPEHYPLVVPEVLDKLNKIIYLDERAYFFGDITRFFLACNNDEYAVLSLPKGDNADGIMGNAFSLNLARLRAHHFVTSVQNGCVGLTASEVFCQFIGNQAGRFPWWTYNVTDINKDGKIFYDRHRCDERWGVWEHAMLYFGEGVEPWKNIQALYSVYWWEIASELPASIPFVHIDDDAADLWYRQSVELCEARGGRKYVTETAAATGRNRSGDEGAHKQSAVRRTMRYLKLHGVKQTIKKIFSKISGK